MQDLKGTADEFNCTPWQTNMAGHIKLKSDGSERMIFPANLHSVGRISMVDHHGGYGIPSPVAWMELEIPAENGSIYAVRYANFFTPQNDPENSEKRIFSDFL